MCVIATWSGPRVLPSSRAGLAIAQATKWRLQEHGAHSRFPAPEIHSPEDAAPLVRPQQASPAGLTGEKQHGASGVSPLGEFLVA